MDFYVSAPKISKKQNQKGSYTITVGLRLYPLDRILAGLQQYAACVAVFPPRRGAPCLVADGWWPMGTQMRQFSAIVFCLANATVTLLRAPTRPPTPRKQRSHFFPKHKIVERIPTRTLGSLRPTRAGAPRSACSFPGHAIAHSQGTHPWRSPPRRPPRPRQPNRRFSSSSALSPPPRPPPPPSAAARPDRPRPPSAAARARAPAPAAAPSCPPTAASASPATTGLAWAAEAGRPADPAAGTGAAGLGRASPTGSPTSRPRAGPRRRPPSGSSTSSCASSRSPTAPSSPSAGSPASSPPASPPCASSPPSAEVAV
jgi:hypothetical protein